MNEKGNILFGKRNIEFSVVRSSRKTVSLFVDPDDGVFLRAPVNTPFRLLSDIVHSKAPWIIDKQRRISELVEHAVKKEFVSGETFLYFGKQFRLKIIKNDREKGKIILQNGRFHVFLSKKTNSKFQKYIVKGLLNKWYKRHARIVLEKRINIYMQKSGMAINKLFLGSQQKRWGSCDKNGNLRFNWHIIMAPVSLIDYVVMHELSHVKYKDHSKEFWQLLGTNLPDYEQRRERLRKEGTRYIF